MYCMKYIMNSKYIIFDIKKTLLNCHRKSSGRKIVKHFP